MKQLTPSKTLAVSLIGCLLAVCSYGTVYAQKTGGLSGAEKQAKRDSLVNSSDYIFEASGGSPGYDYVNNDENVYTLKSYTIRNVLRGDTSLKGQRIYVNSTFFQTIYDADTESFRRYYNKTLQGVMEVHSGIIFCKKGERPDNRIESKSFPAFDGEKDFMCTETALLGVGIARNPFLSEPEVAKKYGYTGEYYGLYGLNFEDKNDIYRYLSGYKNIRIPEEADTSNEGKPCGSTLKSGGENNNPYGSWEAINAELNMIKYGTAVAPLSRTYPNSDTAVRRPALPPSIYGVRLCLISHKTREFCHPCGFTPSFKVPDLQSGDTVEVGGRRG